MKNWRISCILQSKTCLFALLTVLLLLVSGAALAFGSSGLLSDIQNSASAGHRILVYVRVPRLVGCLLSGSALAVSGVLIQSVLNNPLAAPNIIGVHSGAGLAVTLVSAFLPLSYRLVPLAAFAGAFLAVFLVLCISARADGSKITVILAGVVVSTVFSALIDVVVTLKPDSLNGYTNFKIGGLSGVSMNRLIPAACMILPILLLVLLVAPALDVLMLGRETAQSLGLAVKPVRCLFLAAAAALAGASVSFAGLLGFIGVMVPHLMRRLAGRESRILIPASALAGAILMTICDLLARTLFAPYELPVGIVLSLLGGPFFLLILLRRQRSADD